MTNVQMLASLLAAAIMGRGFVAAHAVFEAVNTDCAHEDAACFVQLRGAEITRHDAAGNSQGVQTAPKPCQTSLDCGLQSACVRNVCVDLDDGGPATPPQQCPTGAGTALDRPFDYEHPDKWADLYPDSGDCRNGKQQSPINIDTKSVSETKLSNVAPNYGPLCELSRINNGHGLQVTIVDPEASMGLFKARFPELNGTGWYRAAQFRLHAPSEHTVDGKQHDAELHIVHKKETGEGTDFAVLGFFLQVIEDTNDALAPIFDEPFAPAGCKFGIPEFPMQYFQEQAGPYFTYKGSLTTPPCLEAVTFYLVKQPVTISSSQLSALIPYVGLSGNARPVQPLNGRTVYSSKSCGGC